MSYIPANNLQEKYTIQDLQPLREIIKERLIPTLPDKINSICSTNFHLGKLYLLNYIETFNDQVFPTNKTYFIKL